MALEPSHRLALDRFRRNGLVLPFGAHGSHFDCPNRFLFTPSGRWVLADYANPLESWKYVTLLDVLLLAKFMHFNSIEDVIASGKAHGTTRDDLYGCLYFHVSDQLRTFANRLACLKVTFKCFNMDIIDLSTAIVHNKLLPFGINSSIRFDRIEVSNVVDNAYAGVAPVIESWGKLLKRTSDASLLAYFMNWSQYEGGAQPIISSGKHNQLWGKLKEEGRVCFYSYVQYPNFITHAYYF